MSPHPLAFPPRRPRRTALVGALLLAGAALEAETMTGGTYVLVGAPATGGTFQGGGYVLTGGVATAGAGTSTGEAFQLTSGLLGLYPGPFAEVRVEIELTPGGQVRIRWPAELTGYRLEVTSALGPDALWQPVGPDPAGNEHLAEPSQPARFYRLRQR